MSETVWTLVRVFVPLSLVSFGGARTILADIEHQAIAHHWVTHAEFVEIFAIARAAPGPGTTMVTLIGWKAAGWLGALAASLAIYVPAGLMLLFVSVLWRRHEGSPWRRRLERAFAPISIGLILAGTVVVLNATSGGVLAYAVAAAAAAALRLRQVHPLFLLCAGSAVFAFTFLVM